jgi:asparagine synthase (glutamine-hydrolysing)
MDFEGPGDDRPHLAALLRKLDAETIRVGADEVGSISDDTFIQDAAPYIWPTAAVDLVARRRAKAWGAQATVSGGGGDQILDGDDASFARRVASGSLLAVLEAARLQVPYNSSPRKRLARFVINPILRPYVPQSWLRRRRAQALGAAAYSHWAGPRLRQQLTSTLAIPPQLSEDWLTAYALSHEMMDAADVRRQAESACGLPQIDPYLDPEFIELVASFPPEELFSGGRTRGLFRDAMRGLLPESLRLRRDKAEFSPLVDATFAQFGGAGAFRDLLTMEASADLGIVDPVVFRGWFDRITKGEQVCYGWFNVWPALGVEAFLRSARGSRDAAELGDA